MNKLEFYLKTKSPEITKIQEEIDLKNLEKFYLIDYCKKNKCKILFGDKS